MSGDGGGSGDGGVGGATHHNHSLFIDDCCYRVVPCSVHTSHSSPLPTDKNMDVRNGRVGSSSSCSPHHYHKGADGGEGGPVHWSSV